MENQLPEWLTPGSTSNPYLEKVRQMLLRRRMGELLYFYGEKLVQEMEQSTQNSATSEPPLDEQERQQISNYLASLAREVGTLHRTKLGGS